MKMKRGKVGEILFLGRRKGEGKRRRGGNRCCVVIMRE